MTPSDAGSATSDGLAELLPCPFCGGAPKELKDDYVEALRPEKYPEGGRTRIVCGCEACHKFNTRAEAVAAWNTRAALSPPSAPGDVGARRVPTSREVMEWGGVDPNAPFEVGPFPMEMRSAQWELEDDDAVLNAIAVMMSEFVDNWPAHKKISTSLALIAKTLRAVLRPPPTVEKLAAAIKTTEYKYFGDYEFSDDQHNAVDTLVNFARHGITALSASAAEGEALRGAWQPIETAPRDGSWFLACSNTPGWGATRVVRFHYPDDRLPIHGEGVMWPSAPTHWRPLPAPPALTSPDGGRNG
jgi:hypothetical protein